ALPRRCDIANSLFQLSPRLALGRLPLAENFLGCGHVVNLEPCFNQCRPCPLMVRGAFQNLSRHGFGSPEISMASSPLQFAIEGFNLASARTLARRKREYG